MLFLVIYDPRIVVRPRKAIDGRWPGLFVFVHKVMVVNQLFHYHMLSGGCVTAVDNIISNGII